MAKIWTNHSFNDEIAEFRELLSGHELFVFPPNVSGATGEARIALERADIAFGLPDPDAILSCDNVRWLAINLAGYTPYDRDDLRENFRRFGRVFTNSSSLYAEPCAQHAFAMMIALARQIPQASANQLGAKAWPSEALRFASYLLNHQSVVILGYGAIARRLVELLAPYDMKITGYRRKIAGNEGIPMVTDISVDEALAHADHVVNILPANEATDNFFDLRRFGKLKQGARFYNIGRGTTVDQDALLKALHSGHLASAYLDVMNPEPLPSDNPLWTAPNCFITTHTAGGFDEEKRMHVHVFVEKLNAYLAGEELKDRVY